MRTLSLTLATAMAVTLAVPGHAQLGGLMKKAKAAAGVDKPAAVVKVESAPVGPVKVKPADRIDEPSLDLFARALTAEKQWLEERARIRTTLKSPEDYRRCSEVALAPTTPEAKKMMQDYLDAMASKDNDGSAEYMTKIAMAMKAQQDRIVQGKCGYDPSLYPPEPGPSALYHPSEHEAAKLVGMDQKRYALLKERITPFCAFDAAARGAGDVRVPGIGTGVYYVYEASEAALLTPRCSQLLAGMKAVS